jgi:hypothetical protein
MSLNNEVRPQERELRYEYLGPVESVSHNLQIELIFQQSDKRLKEAQFREIFWLIGDQQLKFVQKEIDLNKYVSHSEQTFFPMKNDKSDLRIRMSD